MNTERSHTYSITTASILQSLFVKCDVVTFCFVLCRVRSYLCFQCMTPIFRTTQYMYLYFIKPKHGISLTLSNPSTVFHWLY